MSDDSISGTFYPAEVINLYLLYKYIMECFLIADGNVYTV